MEPCAIEYRGFDITVTPQKDHHDLWDFRYQITRHDDPAKTAIGHSVARRQTMDGHTTPEAACESGLQLAKVEVDNFLALGK